jgi:hypothetical protein
MGGIFFLIDQRIPAKTFDEVRMHVRDQVVKELRARVTEVD